MSENAQRKTIDLQTGLFLMRYNTAEDVSFPPVVRVSADQASEGNCDIIVAPDSADGTLWSPQSCLVVTATRPSKLIVEVSPQRPGGSTAANIMIEPLTQGIAPIPQILSSASMSAPDLEDLRIIAHVAGIGDMSEKANTWIAGPKAPARIEGFSIQWPNKPHDLDINYAVKFARPQRGEGQFVPVGTFAGTRGRALPLTGVTLETSGSAASRYNMTAEAIFLGAPALKVTGTHIKLAGPSGREPLVGIKLNIEQAVISWPAPASPEPANAAVPVQRTGSRVRVFRSRQSIAKPVG